jgi:hypothetical protein
MGTVNIEWVKFGSRTDKDGAQNCILHTVATEQITSTSGSNSQSGGAPNGANAAIVYALEDHFVAFKSGDTDPDAEDTARMRLLATKETVFGNVQPGDKIAAITV